MRIIIIAVVLLAAFVGLNSLFVVKETEYAIKGGGGITSPACTSRPPSSTTSSSSSVA